MRFGLLSNASIRAVVSAAVAGLGVVAALVVLAPAVVHLDMDGREPAVIEGVHGPERMYARVARWTSDLTHIEWSGQIGVAPVAVEIELAPFFGRAGEQAQIVVGHRLVRHTLSDDWQTVRVPLSGPSRDVVLEIRAQSHNAGADPRVLGIRLDRVSIVNGSRVEALKRAGWLSILSLWLIGALAWVTGGWLASGRSQPWRTAGRVAGGAIAVALVHGMRAWLLSPSGVALMAGAAILAWALVTTLRRGEDITRPIALAVALACATAWLANAVLTSWYFVDVLRLDAWEAVPTVEHVRAGTFSVTELWAPHNEHRPLTGRVVALACALLARWNHWWEFGALQVVAALQLVAMAWFVARPGRTWRVSPAILVGAVACFTATTHWETWLRGFSVHILAGVVAPSVALLLLCVGRPGWTTVAAAASMTVIGELSFGAGLLIWPIGAVVIARRRQPEWQRHVSAWLVVGIVCTALYVPGLHVHPGAADSAGLAFSGEGLTRIVAGVLVTLGTAVYYAPSAFDGGSSALQTAVIAGAGMAVATWAALIVLRWRQDAERDGAWLFPATLGAFGLGACLLVSAGRVSGGLLALTASRYLFFAACFWASLLLLIGLRAGSRRLWSRGLVTILAGAVVAAMVANSIASIPYMAGEFARVRQARRQLLKGDVGTAAHVLYPDPFKLEHMRAVLQTYRLSVFRPGTR